MKRLCLFTLCLLIPEVLPLTALGQIPDNLIPQTGLQAPSPKPLPQKTKVGVFLVQPFAVKTGDAYKGYCIDLWKKMAADLGLEYEYIPFTSVSDLLEATRDRKVDVGIGNISITAKRLETLDFSLPFLRGGMQIMVNERRGTSWIKLWNGLRESGHLQVFGFGLILILIITILLTLGERKWNKEFYPDWGNGLAESFYHVMSVAMSGKTNHKALPGASGKVLAAIWIAFGVGVVAYITSSVTSVMTVNSLKGIIDGPHDLPGHHVGVVRGTLSQEYCRDRDLNTSTYETLPDAVNALVRQEVEAVVGDAMTLQWYDNAHPELPITEVGPIFMEKGYGFTLPVGSTLRQDLNSSLLNLQDSGFMETLRKEYFGDIP